MSTTHSDALKIEWQVLQTQFDSYEKWSLVIKLAHLTFVSTALLTLHPITLGLLYLSLLFWLCDGIWKTFQSRIETRLLNVEDAIAQEFKSNNVEVIPCQFNQTFLASRPSSFGLITDYLTNALKPTVALVHAGIVAFYGLVLFVSQ